MSWASLERDIVDENFSGEGLEELLFRLKMGRVLFEGSQSGAIAEPHEEGEVEGIIDHRSIARDGGAVSERGDESGGFLQLLGPLDQGGAVGVIARALEPNKDGVLDGAGVRRGACGQEQGEEEDEPGHAANLGPKAEVFQC